MLSLILCVCASIVFGAVERFDNQRVLRFQASNEAQIAEFEQLFVNEAAGVDVWKNVAGEIDVLVQTHEGEKKLADFLQKHGLTPSVFIDDVQAAVDRTFEEAQGVVAPELEFFTKYQTLDKIHEFLRDIESRYPNIATVFSAGKTYEGRDILGIELSTGSAQNKKKLVNLGGHHAREWVGVAVNAYFVHYFASEYGTNQRVTDLLNKVDIVVFPVVNADGYSYTFTNNRMWRKTRKPNCCVFLE